MSWRCRHGFHRWFFVSMSDKRAVYWSGETLYRCSLIERCDRCGVTRTRPNAEVPKRVRISAPSGRSPDDGD